MKSNIHPPSVFDIISDYSIQEMENRILNKISLNINDLRLKGVYIFGIGKMGSKIFDFLSKTDIKVNGFLDNYSCLDNDKSFRDIKILKIQDIDEDSIVYVASVTHLELLYQQLISNGFKYIITHFDAGIIFKKYPNFPFEPYQQGLIEDIYENKSKYSHFYKLLKDDLSKQTFNNILSFRLTFNQKMISNCARKTELQYFDDTAIELDKKEIFFDIGGFDGDSSINFIKKVKNEYASVHFFEPDIELINSAKKNLSKFKNIIFNQLGVFNNQMTLSFNNTGGLDGSIVKSGEFKIDTIDLDSYILNQSIPTYVKMDIEGAELSAIEGAQNLIKSFKPKLAIAIYHYPDHFWKIPLYLNNLNPNYKFKLRHYTDTIFETILYAI
jgi:FkbM family methyltransferase